MLAIVGSGASPDGLGDLLGGEQESSSGSAFKIIQTGNVNGFNANMAKSAGADYKAIDFLSGRNMSWTS